MCEGVKGWWARVREGGGTRSRRKEKSKIHLTQHKFFFKPPTNLIVLHIIYNIMYIYIRIYISQCE